MYIDFWTAAIWIIVVGLGVHVTSFLYRRLGLLLASQGAIMSLAALVDVQAAPALGGQISWIAGVGTAVLLGLLHYAVLKHSGPMLLLLLSAVFQIVVATFWRTFPGLTGGSGGLLLLDSMELGALVAMLLLVANILLTSAFLWSRARSESRFSWSLAKFLGPKAEAFGVPARSLQLGSLLCYGVALGVMGIISTRYFGYLTERSYGLALALTMVMIAVVWPSRPVWAALSGATLYSVLRVIITPTIGAASGMSAILEASFPLALVGVVGLRHWLCSANASERENGGVAEEAEL